MSDVAVDQADRLADPGIGKCADPAEAFAALLVQSRPQDLDEKHIHQSVGEDG